jgi:hypothetical protein
MNYKQRVEKEKKTDLKVASSVDTMVSAILFKPHFSVYLVLHLINRQLADNLTK